MATYQNARKMNLLPEVPSEVLVQFSTESSEKAVRSECNARYDEMLDKALENAHENDEVGGVEA